jgi:hypothetical protein
LFLAKTRGQVQFLLDHLRERFAVTPERERHVSPRACKRKQKPKKNSDNFLGLASWLGPFLRKSCRTRQKNLEWEWQFRYWLPNAE